MLWVLKWGDCFIYKCIACQNMSSHYSSVLVWKIFTSKHFFYMRVLLQETFLCLRLPANTFFLLAYNLFQNFPYLSIPIIVHFRISSIGLFVNLLTIVTFSFFFFSDIWIVVYFSQRSSKNYLSVSFRISRSLLWTPILNSILLFVPKPLAPWPS